MLTLLIFLIPRLLFLQNEVKLADLEKFLFTEKTVLEDQLFLKGYKLAEEGRDLIWINQYDYIYNRGTTTTDFSEVVKSFYRGQPYSIQYLTYLESEFDDLRKQVILKGYTRTSRHGVVYETSKFHVGFATTLDSRGQKKYSVHIANMAIENKFELK